MTMRNARRTGGCAVLCLALGAGCARDGAEALTGGDASDWSRVPAAEAGWNEDALDAFAGHVGGSGCVIHKQRMLYDWGGYIDYPFDAASAVKPVYAHLLYAAVADGRIGGLDDPICWSVPALSNLNAGLDFKDRSMTWRHLVTQTACYGMRKAPGTAFNYSDYQMALLIDSLVNHVFATGYDRFDGEVAYPLLWDRLGCRDWPTFVKQGSHPGRLHISPRDFARFGQLYLDGGAWNGAQLIPRRLAVQAVTSPHQADLPRTRQEDAAMLPGQRTIGAGPNHEAHLNSFSYTWWINGTMDEGRRVFPEMPADCFMAAGHGGKAMLVVCPSLDLVVCWMNGFRGVPILRFYLDGRQRVRRALWMLMQALPEGAASAPAGEARAQTRTP
jgi:CubicO group peptidase (beta-lactamase class C family)